jgi:hypothetical protein
MGVSVFPAPTTGGGALPQGAVANVASGYAATGGWKYTTSTAAGTYQVNIQAPSTNIYGIETANGVTQADIPGGSVVPLNTTATEASITVGSYHPYQATVFSTSVGTIRNINGGNGLHIMTTNSGYIYTSTDSLTWTNRTSGGEGTGQNNYPATYVNDRWIIPGWDGAASNGRGVLHSTNGTTWTTLDLSSVQASRTINVYYAGGLWVAINPSGAATTGQIATSTNFSSWTGRTTPTTNAPYSMVYANVQGTNYYIVACSGGVIFYSTNASSWTSTGEVGGPREIYNILTNGRTIIFCGQNGATASANGVIYMLTPVDSGVPESWISIPLQNNYTLGSNFTTAGYFLGTYVLYLSNANSASTTSSVPDGRIGITKCLTSPDGFTWTMRAIPRVNRSSGPLQQQANGVVAYGLTGRIYATTAFNSAAIHINSTALASV